MLELKNVCVSAGVDDEIEIINNISLTLDEKKIYVVTGPNGGGKTSLAKAIMGIYPASGGQIYLDGEEITGKTITERAALGIGYAFQAPPRFKGLRVRDMLAIACWGPQTRTPATRDSDEKLLFSLLADVGLCAQDYIDRQLDASFSGGELKRVEIASILARSASGDGSASGECSANGECPVSGERPTGGDGSASGEHSIDGNRSGGSGGGSGGSDKGVTELRVALFDEPEAGIDLWSFQKLTETFRQLNHNCDTTIVIISHQERILRLADEVILICGGKITEIASPDKILGDVDYFAEPGSFCPNCYTRK